MLVGNSGFDVNNVTFVHNQSGRRVDERQSAKEENVRDSRYFFFLVRLQKLRILLFQRKGTDLREDVVRLTVNVSYVGIGTHFKLHRSNVHLLKNRSSKT